MDADVCVVQGTYDGTGGEARVATALARTFDAPVITDGKRTDAVPEEVTIQQVRKRLATRLLDWSPLPGEVAESATWLRRPELQEYDVVLGSGLAPGWYVPRPDQTVVQYVHSTPRLQTDRLQPDATGGVRQLYALAGRLLYAQRPDPDLYLANSEITARAIRRQWGVPDGRIEVVYPPVPVGAFGAGEADGGDRSVVPDEPFYLSLSRLGPLKRVEMLVEAFQDLDQRLVVAGDGPRRDAVEKLAEGHENVEVVGRVDEPTKRALLASAEATLLNTDREAFGIAPVESLASGTPLLAVESGFPQFYVERWGVGRTFEATPAAIGTAVEAFDAEGVDRSAAALQQFAAQFSPARFAEEVRAAVESARTGWEPSLPAAGDVLDV